MHESRKASVAGFFLWIQDSEGGKASTTLAVWPCPKVLAVWAEIQLLISMKEAYAWFLTDMTNSSLAFMVPCEAIYTQDGESQVTENHGKVQNTYLYVFLENIYNLFWSYLPCHTLLSPLSTDPFLFLMSPPSIFYVFWLFFFFFLGGPMSFIRVAYKSIGN